MAYVVAANPRGIFDRSTKGWSTPLLTVAVERGRVRFFAQTLGGTDPVHLDVAAARAAGYPDLLAPPSFLAVVEADAHEELRRQGHAAPTDVVRCDYRYLLHGEERYELHGPLHAGEDVSFQTTILDFHDRKGGAMELATFRSEIRHAARGLLVSATRTLLHRLPGPEARA